MMKPLAKLLNANSFSKLYRWLAFIGLLVHVSWSVVSDGYFRYQTTTEYTTERMHQKNHYDMIPNLNLCLRITDILDYVSLNNVTGHQWRRSEDFAQWSHLHSQLTLRQMFEFTPKTRELMSLCFYRIKDGFILSLFPSISVCQELFEVDRYFAQQYMCYIVRPKFPFSLANARAALTSPSTLFGYTLGPKFAGVNKMLVSIFYGSYPFVAQHYSSIIYRLIDYDHLIPYYRSIRFTYYWFMRHLLPPPYDTMCHDRDKCMHDCWQSLESKIGSVFYDRIVPETEDTQQQFNLDRCVVSYDDMDNQTIRQLLRKGTCECDDRCRGMWCNYDYSVTQLDASRTSLKNNESLSVYAKSERAPGVLAISLPRIDVMAFLVYLSNCLEIWLGVHFVSCSQAAWRQAEQRLRRWRRRRSRKRHDKERQGGMVGERGPVYWTFIPRHQLAHYGSHS